MKFDIREFFENLWRKYKFHFNRTRIKDTLHEGQYIYFFIMSRSFLLRMRNVWDKSCRENQNTHFMFNIFFFENHAFYKKMWKNIVQWSRPQKTIWRMRITYWILTATNTHTQEVVQHSLLFHSNNGCTKAPQCYVVLCLSCWRICR
jgi:hypothetical protein